MKKFFGLVFLILILTMVLILGACSKQATTAVAGTEKVESAAVRTLTVAGKQGEPHKNAKYEKAYCNLVTKYSGGRLVLDYLGGRDIINEKDIVAAVQNHVIDIAMDKETLSAIEPLYACMSITGMTQFEEAACGLFDLYDDVYSNAENGVKWIGKAAQPQWWVLATVEDIPTPASVKGMKIRCLDSTSSIVEALGGVPTVIPYSDIYTAMERGVIDGFLMCPEMWVESGFHEVSNYFLTIRFFQGGQSGVLVNWDVWNSLTEEEQNWLEAPLQEELSARLFQAIGYYNQMSGEQEMIEAGVTAVNWTAEQEAKVLADTKVKTWEMYKDKLDPDVAKRFAKLVGLKY